MFHVFDRKPASNYQPVQIELQPEIEPVPNLSESESRALHEAWREKQ